MQAQDQLHAFLFETLGVRGRVIRLERTWQEILARHEYSADVQQVLGKAALAGALLADNLKHQGNMHLQMQGDGALRLLLVQCDSELKLRAMARGDAQAVTGTMRELLGQGRMTVTLDPGAGAERYQGIIDLAGDDVASCLEAYFRDSEQLPTRFWLAVDGERAVGLMLQKLPQSAATDDDWETLGILADTLHLDELAQWSTETLLYRLFADHDIRLFDARPVTYDCRCTPEHLDGVLRLLGADEIRQVVAERGELAINCEFCNKTFRYDPIDVEAVFAPPGSRAVH